MQKYHIQINLKRFDIPKEKGGICTAPYPTEWISSSIQEIINLGWGCHKQIELTIFVPELLLIPAVTQVLSNLKTKVSNLKIGTQSCHFDDVSIDGNFGAFTSLPLASGQSANGARATIIGHCEERAYLKNMMSLASEVNDVKLQEAISIILAKKANHAFKQDMQVTFCIGETAEQRGEGDNKSQIDNAKKILQQQIFSLMDNIENEQMLKCIVLAYEPIWAIGPGKTTPTEDYISMISDFISSYISGNFGLTIPVIYGGGLKDENASKICGIPTIDGGLIALTKFTPPIGFYSDGFDQILKNIIRPS